MTKPGHIHLEDNKVIFVYYELKRPAWLNKRICPDDYYDEENMQISEKYIKAFKEYEASKREVEVENVNRVKKEWYYDNIGIDCPNTDWTISKTNVINNQPCEAEIENGIATITKIL